MSYGDIINLTCYKKENFTKNNLILNNNYMTIKALQDENNKIYDDELGSLNTKFPKKNLSSKNTIPLPNILGIDVFINNTPLNLSSCKIISYKETLHRKKNIVIRDAILEDRLGHKSHLCSKKLLSRSLRAIYCISYSITPLNYDNIIKFTPYIDFSNLTIPLEKIQGDINSKCGVLAFFNPKENYLLSSAIRCELHEGYFKKTSYEKMCCKKNFVSYTLNGNGRKNVPLTLFKYVSVTHGPLNKKDEIISQSKSLVKNACVKNFDTLFSENMR